MDAVAHNPAFAKKVKVPKAVGKDFSEASKGMKFGKDRSVSTRADRQVVNRPKTNQGKAELFKKGGEMKESKAMVKKEVSFMKAKMGAVPSGGNKGKGEHAIQKSGISKGTTVKMSGSKPLGMKNGGMSKGKC